MSSVDDRIVSMQFDNANFERKLAETVKSLDRLQKSLDFEASKRNLSDLSSAGKNFNMGNMAQSVEAVGAKFAALATIGITALATITSHAVQAAGRVLSAFTFRPTIEGFQEYETQLNSVQTILANTASAGTNIDQVNVALQQLNEYSDKTIYNFGQMARNIGTFTAAGVDLDTSVDSIKGIANLAALSGSNSEQASTAMYQLSQAISSGTLKLIDWNSVVNAGMGGEVFKKALFETAKAMGTLETKIPGKVFEDGSKKADQFVKVPIGQTFEEWEKANGSFRESLQSGWVTSDVLTTTLATFTQDLSDAELKSKGFSDSQIANIKAQAKTATEAATKVKTFTQLMGTVKEAIATGWSDSFKIIIGNFEEARELWTNVNDVVSGFIQRTSEARNKTLQSWKDMGGRTILIEALSNVFRALLSVINPIKEAFRFFFPPTTAKDLLRITQSFADFAKRLTISGSTADKIKRSFMGFFAILRMGRSIFVATSQFIVKMLAPLIGAGGSKALDFFARMGDALVRLQTSLAVDTALHKFFKRLEEIFGDAGKALEDFKVKIVDFFHRLGFGGDRLVATEDAVGRVSYRVQEAGNRLERFTNIWDGLSAVLDKVNTVLGRIWDALKGWFTDLGRKLAEVMKPGDFNAAVDILNVGLLGGIAIILKRFLSGDFLKNFGGGLFESVTNTLDALTNKLQAMQANIKADTLMKIAAAVGILAASVFVLSMIDSAALTKALTAMAVGFGQLVGTMAILESMTTIKGAAGLTLVSVAMNLLATSMLILAGAMKILSTMSWEEIERGLGAITGMLAVLVGAAKLLQGIGPGLVVAGAGMIAMAIGLNIMAGAVALFGMMDWDTMIRGIYGIAGSLAAIVVAVNLMPPVRMLAAGLAMIPLATGISILAGALKIFGTMSWEEMGRGLAAMAGALLILAVAINAMPLHLPLIGIGLLMVAKALAVIAAVVAIMGLMKLEDIGKGLLALAGIMLILAVGVNAMNGALVGAAALVIVAGALLLLSTVLIAFSKLSLKELAIGLGAIAGVLLILGVAAAVLQPIVPALMGLGIALALIGAGFALFGVGALAVAKAFDLMARAGKEGAEAILHGLKMVISISPELLKILVRKIVEFVDELLKALPVLIKGITVVLSHLLDTIIELTPKIAEALIVMLTQALRLLREKAPDLVATGAFFILEILRGIRSNIGEITQLAIDITITFAEKVTENASRLVDAAVNLLKAFIGAFGDRVGELIQAGSDFLAKFLEGIANHIANIVGTVAEIVATFIREVANNYTKLIDAGADAIIKFIEGITNNIHKIVEKAVDLIIEFTWALGQESIRVIRAAADLLITFLNALAQTIREKAPELRQAGIEIVVAIIDGMTFGMGSRVRGVVRGAVNMGNRVIRAVEGVFESESPSKVFKRIGRDVVNGLTLGIGDDAAAQNNAVSVAENIVRGFQETLSRIPDQVGRMDEFNPTITPVLDLTKVRASSRGINKMLTAASIVPEVSLDNARVISVATASRNTEPAEAQPYSGPSEVKFEQNIHSPKELSTRDIYRSTRNVITLAKEELSIP